MLTAYYCPEPRSDRVQRLLAGLSEPAISLLVQVELFCAVARKVRSGGIEAAGARRIFALLAMDVVEQRFRLLPLETGEYLQACEWIAQLRTPLRVLDAIHLALARTHNTCLVTADEDLARAAHVLGVACRFMA